MCSLSSCHSAVYMIPAKYTCPQDGPGSTYYGNLVSELYNSGHYHSQFTCVDTALKSVVGSSTSKNGLLFYFVLEDVDHYINTYNLGNGQYNQVNWKLLGQSKGFLVCPYRILYQ